jgi:hypothetical protein
VKSKLAVCLLIATLSCATARAEERDRVAETHAFTVAVSAPLMIPECRKAVPESEKEFKPALKKWRKANMDKIEATRTQLQIDSQALGRDMMGMSVFMIEGMVDDFKQQPLDQKQVRCRELLAELQAV